ncbi:K02A2.6-like [Cordylochernes scorpioides]|uniref:K02A2.6-like n=1 Tax=Cordylochernes scorpioides TaxID=51811 RepID=A0ABY6L520_9ARAC|nr:K02A2.6-like [Cordylochernes scorpioides]
MWKNCRSQQREIATETEKDEVLSLAKFYTQQGWPEKVADHLRPYFQRKLELTVDGECLVWGMRVVIPPSLRIKMLNCLHETHSGMNKMKAVARSHFWWPNLDTQIEFLQLRRLFSSYGLPEELVSDNGPQFTGSEMKGFLEGNGIKQTLIPAYHPQSNGLAERAVRTIKTALDKNKRKIGDTIQDTLSKVLLAYRSTPHVTTGKTPSELFIGRALRTRVSLIHPSLASRVRDQQARQMKYDRRTHLEEFQIDDLVWCKNFRGGDKMDPGKIVGKKGTRVYTILIHGQVKAYHRDQIRKRGAGPNAIISEVVRDRGYVESMSPGLTSQRSDQDSEVQSDTDDGKSLEPLPSLDPEALKEEGPVLRRNPPRARRLPNGLIIHSKSDDIFKNLAFEDWLYKNCNFADTKTSIYLIWSNTPSVVVGRHQNPLIECSLRCLNKNQVKLARRNSGGGTVFHDLGNLNISFITNREAYNRKKNLELICRALKKKLEFGWLFALVSVVQVVLQLSKSWFLKLPEKSRNGSEPWCWQVSGTAAKLGRNVAYHHCTLLVDSDTGLLRKTLATNNVGVESKATQSKPTSVANLRDAHPRLTLKDVRSSLMEEMKQGCQAEIPILELDPIDFLFPGLDAQEKIFRDWEWIHGRTPPFTVTRKDLRLKVAGGRLVEVHCNKVMHANKLSTLIGLPMDLVVSHHRWLDWHTALEPCDTDSPDFHIVLRQYQEPILKSIDKSVNRLPANSSVTVQWLPAHGIPGNELADSLAKAGALGLTESRESTT